MESSDRDRVAGRNIAREAVKFFEQADPKPFYQSRKLIGVDMSRSLACPDKVIAIDCAFDAREKLSECVVKVEEDWL